MNVIHCSQGSAAWLQARTGRVTASEVGDAIHTYKQESKKEQESATRFNYRASLVSEILTGQASDTFVSKYMQYGTEMEPFARAAYEVRYGVEVDTVGFVVHPSIERSGASPDGLIGADGGLEIKCPKTETHLAYLLANRLPPEYEPQVMWNLACTEREWWDFASYDARLPIRHQLFVVRVHRDEQRIAEMENGVRRFLAEVDEMLGRLDELNPEQGRLKKQLQDSVAEDEALISQADIDWIQQRHAEERAQA